MSKLQMYIISLVIVFLAGIGCGYYIGNHRTIVVPEVYAPAITQKDSSVVLSRNPDTTIKPLVTPKNSKVLHSVSVKVKPDTIKAKIDTIIRGDTIIVVKTVGCDTIEVRMDILRQSDGTIRVQAKTNNGTIVGGIDVPVSRIEKNIAFKHAILVSNSFILYEKRQFFDVEYQRMFGVFVLGAKIGTEYKKYDNISVGLKVGIQF